MKNEADDEKKKIKIDHPVIKWLNYVSGEVNKINEEIDQAARPNDNQD